MANLKLVSLQPFGAEASGIDLTGHLADADIRAIEQAMDVHAVLIWREQALDQHQQIAFA